MSAEFVVKFNGHRLKFELGNERAAIVREGEAESVFTSEAEGWIAARQAGLKPAALVTVEQKV